MADDLDFEVCKDYYITVEACDDGNPPLSTATMVVIELMDVNDNAPMFDQDIYNVLISEDASIGQTVTRVTLSPYACSSVSLFCLFIDSILMNVCCEGVCRRSRQPSKWTNYLLNSERRSIQPLLD